MSAKRFTSMAGCAALIASLTAPQAVGAASATSASTTIYDCATEMAALNDEVIRSTPPASAGLIVYYQHMLYMSQRTVQVLDSYCRAEPNYQQSRQEYQTIYDLTLQNCREQASDQSACRPRRYGS